LLVYLYASLFVSFFVSLSARLRENGWTDLHEIFREGAEWPWDDLSTFFINSEKPHDAAIDAQHGDGVCCAFAPQPVAVIPGYHSKDWLKIQSVVLILSFKEINQQKYNE